MVGPAGVAACTGKPAQKPLLNKKGFSRRWLTNGRNHLKTIAPPTLGTSTAQIKSALWQPLVARLITPPG